jgi:uncharacterized protein (DUF1778 family)
MMTGGNNMSAESRTPPTEGVLIRFDPKHLKLVSQAADYLGLPRSAWMRATVLREARQILAEKPEKQDEDRSRKSA